MTTPPANEVFDTPVAALVFSVFDLFRGVFIQIIIHPDAIPLTAFFAPNGHNKWLRQGAAGVSACFVCVMLFVTATLDMI